jgi:hypothetical protein
MVLLFFDMSLTGRVMTTVEPFSKFLEKWKQPNKTHSEMECSSSCSADVASARVRFLPEDLEVDFSSAEGREEDRLTRFGSSEDERVLIGGKALFPDDMLPKEVALKACAKEGNDWGTWVAMEP